MGTTPLTSFAEFEQLPSGPELLELLKGEMVRLPSAQHDHMDVPEHVYNALYAWRNANPSTSVGKVYMERGYLIPINPPSWLRPDVSVTDVDQPRDPYYKSALLIAFEAWVYREYNHPTLEQDAMHSDLLSGLTIPRSAVFGAAAHS